MALASALPDLRVRLSGAVNVQAEAMRSEIYGVLEEYRVGRGQKWPGQRNTSSAPGDAPARQSGRLMESVKVLQRSTPRRPVAEVGPDPAAFKKSYYAPFLEFGTHRIKPRPFMRTAVARYRQKMR